MIFLQYFPFADGPMRSAERFEHNTDKIQPGRSLGKSDLSSETIKIGMAY